MAKIGFNLNLALNKTLVKTSINNLMIRNKLFLPKNVLNIVKKPIPILSN